MTAQERSVLDRFVSSRPQRPYCANRFDFGLKIRPLEEALHFEHIQLGSGSSGAAGLKYLAVDYDEPDVAIAVATACLPPPTITATNRANFHAHALWELAVPISRHNKKALALAEATRRGIARAIGADPAFNGRNVKNPLHAKWAVSIVDCRYSLRDFPVRLSPTWENRPKIDLSNAVGRNDALFRETAKYARGRVKMVEAEFQFAYDVEAFCHEFNERFAEPLPGSEVRSTAKSVIRWVWARRANFQLSSANRGACHLPTLPPVMEVTQRKAEVRKRRQAGAVYVNTARSGATAEKVKSAIARLETAGKAATKSAVAQLTGISKRTLQRYYSPLFRGDVRCTQYLAGGAGLSGAAGDASKAVKAQNEAA